MAIALPPFRPTPLAKNFEALDLGAGGNCFSLPVAAADDIRKTLYQNRLARYLCTSIAFGGVRADGFAQRSADRVSQGVLRTARIRRDSIKTGTAIAFVADQNVGTLFPLYRDANVAAPLAFLGSDGVRQESLFELRDGKLFTDGNELLFVRSTDRSIAAEDETIVLRD